MIESFALVASSRAFVKTCTDCKLTKPVASFRPLRCRCRHCERVLSREYARQAWVKSTVSQRRRTPVGKSITKAWRNTEKGKAYQKVAAARASMRAWQSAYSKTPAARAKRAAYAKTEKSKAQRKRYSQTEKGRAVDRHKAHKRRAREKSGTATTADVQRLFKAAKRCHYCQKKFSKKGDKTLDHIVPFATGGLHSPDNFCAACRACNSRKNSMSPESWAQRIGLLLI